MMQAIIIIIYICLSISGLVLMKLGGNPGTISMAEGNINLGISPISLLGFICYICSFLLLKKSLQQQEL